MSSSNIMTLEDLKRARKDVPAMSFKTKKGPDKPLELKEKLDELWWKNQMKEIDKQFGPYYDYEKF